VKRKYIHHRRIVHTTKKELWRTGERRGKKDIEVHIPMNKLAAAVGAHCLVAASALVPIPRFSSSDFTFLERKFLSGHHLRPCSPLPIPIWKTAQTFRQNSEISIRTELWHFEKFCQFLSGSGSGI